MICFGGDFNLAGTSLFCWHQILVRATCRPSRRNCDVKVEVVLEPSARFEGSHENQKRTLTSHRELRGIWWEWEVMSPVSNSEVSFPVLHVIGSAARDAAGRFGRNKPTTNAREHGEPCSFSSTIHRRLEIALPLQSSQSQMGLSRRSSLTFIRP